LGLSFVEVFVKLSVNRLTNLNRYKFCGQEVEFNQKVLTQSIFLDSENQQAGQTILGTAIVLSLDPQDYCINSVAADINRSQF
tara:strand:- start:35 stop:283 length:249 start_codon:yes stop_codon:yes gene_type:complete